MSSKRSTNNSVSTLEDQSSVIAAVSSEGGLLAEVPQKSLSEKTKVGKKKTGKNKTVEQRSPLVDPVPGQPSPGNRRSGRAAPGRDVTGSVDGNVMSDGAVDPVVGPGGVATNEATGNQGHVAMASGSTSGAAGFGQQMFWPYPFQPFGNFVPNFSFGEVEQPSWDEEDPAVVPRQQDHEISDDEGSEDETLVGEGLEEPEGPQRIAEDLDLLDLKGDGKIIRLVKEQLNQVKDADKVSPKITPGMAKLLDKYLTEAQGLAEMEKLAKTYPRTENVAAMKVPRLDAEVYQVLEQRVRGMDQGFQAIQKGVLGAMSALAPAVDIAIARGDKDPELDDLDKNLLDGMLQLAYVHNNISAKRREILRPFLAPVYAKALTKGHDTTPEWLFGGDLLTTTKRCEAARRIGDKILKRKPQQQQQGGKQQGNQQKRFKGPRQQTQGFKGGNQFQQQFRFPNPQSFQQFMPYASTQFPTMGNFYQKAQGNPRPQGQRQQGFQKKTTYQK